MVGTGRADQLEAAIADRTIDDILRADPTLVSWFSVNWNNAWVELVCYGRVLCWGEGIVPVSRRSITG